MLSTIISVYFLFPKSYAFVCLIAMATISRIMLIRNGHSGPHCSVPNHSEKTLNCPSVNKI